MPDGVRLGERTVRLQNGVPGASRSAPGTGMKRSVSGSYTAYSAGIAPVPGKLWEGGPHGRVKGPVCRRDVADLGVSHDQKERRIHAGLGKCPVELLHVLQMGLPDKHVHARRKRRGSDAGSLAILFASREPMGAPCRSWRLAAPATARCTAAAGLSWRRARTAAGPPLSSAARSPWPRGTPGGAAPSRATPAWCKAAQHHRQLGATTAGSTIPAPPMVYLVEGRGNVRERRHVV